MSRFIAVLIIAVSALAARAAELSPRAVTEIEHLLQHLAQSGCEFNRNGKWYDAADARAHLQRKYEYLAKKKFVESAEDFISRAATESSRSHLPYTVRCGGKLQASADWLRTELQRFRMETEGPK